MDKNQITPTTRQAQDAERCNVFLCVLSAMTVIGMLGGLLFAKSWLDLLLIVGTAVWAAVGILNIAFIVGACGGYRRG